MAYIALLLSERLLVEATTRALDADPWTRGSERATCATIAELHSHMVEKAWPYVDCIITELNGNFEDAFRAAESLTNQFPNVHVVFITGRYVVLADGGGTGTGVGFSSVAKERIETHLVRRLKPVLFSKRGCY